MSPQRPAGKAIAAQRRAGKSQRHQYEVQALTGLKDLALEMRDGNMGDSLSAREALERVLSEPDILECLHALGFQHEDDIARDALDADQQRDSAFSDPNGDGSEGER